MSSEANVAYVAKFIKKLFVDNENSSGVIDFYTEIGFDQEGNIKSFSSTSGVFTNIQKEFFNCVQSTLKAHKCNLKNVRFHYGDYRLRFISPKNDASYIYNKYDNGQPMHIIDLVNFYDNNDVTNIIVKSLGNQWKSGNKGKFVDFLWYNLLIGKIKKNFNMIPNTYSINVQDKLEQFFKTNIEELFTYYFDVNTNIDPNKMFAVTVCSTVMDIYLLSRVFKKFERKNKEKIHQDFANKIIIVSGNNHTILYKKFLVEYLGYELIYTKTSKFYNFVETDPGVYSNRRCLNISDMPQKIFKYGEVKSVTGGSKNKDDLSESERNETSEANDVTNNSKIFSEMLNLIDKSDLKGAEKLIKEHPIVLELFNNINDGCFHYVCYTNNIAMAELLLKYGAYIDVQNNIGFTGLHIAVENNNIDLVDFLIDNGACIDAKDIIHYTPLMWACFRQNIDFEIIELLVKSGTNVNIRNIYGESALILAGGRDPKVSKLLLENGAMLNAQSNSGVTALHMALFRKNKKTAIFLIESGCNINLLSNSDKLPIDIVWEFNSLEDIQDIINVMKKHNPEEFKNDFNEHYYLPGNMEDLTDNFDKSKNRVLAGPVSIHVIKSNKDNKEFLLIGDYHVFGDNLSCDSTLGEGFKYYKKYKKYKNKYLRALSDFNK